MPISASHVRPAPGAVDPAARVVQIQIQLDPCSPEGPALRLDEEISVIPGLQSLFWASQTRVMLPIWQWACHADDALTRIEALLRDVRATALLAVKMQVWHPPAAQLAAIEHDAELRVWTTDAAAALAFFGLSADRYDVRLIQAGPETEREQARYRSDAQLYGVSRRADLIDAGPCDAGPCEVVS